MSDIWIAIAVMSLVSAAAATLAVGCLYTQKGQAVMLLLSLSILAAVVFQLYLAGQLYWAKLVPHSAAIIYTNLAAVFAALAAGWGWRLPNTPAWRRGIVSVGMGAVSGAMILWPLLSMALRPPPPGRNVWKGPVAMQTSWATCSPAAAATLLNAEGMQVGEREMIPLCLADSHGTPTLGLYRGVKLVADRHGRQVEIVDATPEELLQNDDWPVLLAVKLPYGVEDPRYTEQWGWIPGMGHTVVALGRTPDGALLIGDPAVGLERWRETELETLWHGEGIRVK